MVRNFIFISLLVSSSRSGRTIHHSSNRHPRNKKRRSHISFIHSRPPPHIANHINHITHRIHQLAKESFFNSPKPSSSPTIIIAPIYDQPKNVIPSRIPHPIPKTPLLPLHRHPTIPPPNLPHPPLLYLQFYRLLLLLPHRRTVRRRARHLAFRLPGVLVRLLLRQIQRPADDASGFGGGRVHSHQRA